MIGTTISHYRILEKLGQGGMGEVFLAQDTELERKVAIKFLPPHVAQDREMLERFEREAKATAALQHPNIVTIHEIGTHDGRRFIVMAYIDGDLLATRIARGDVSIQESVDIAAALADALKEAHGADIIHRDLKPDNIIIDKRGQPHVLDFGLAVHGGATRLTREGSTVGTLHYMSPEQTRGEEVDERTDIFSLGAILYEMVTGRKAFAGDNTAAIVNRIANEEPQPMARYCNNVPEELDRIVATALAKDRDIRYQTMSGLAAALKPLQSGSGSAIISGMRSTVSQPAEKPRRVPAWGIYAALAVIAAGAWFGLRALSRGQTNAVAPATKTASSKLSQIRSLAVLPLRNTSESPDESYFADAMTEAIIDDLSHVSALSVLPASSVMQFRDSDKSLPEIAAELDADAIITGSVWKSEGRVRINVDLIPADGSARLWGESYESDFDNLLALQSRLAREITGQVKVSIDPLEDAWLTEQRNVNPEALRVYLKGVYYANLMSGDSYKKAAEMFERAMALDPDFAPAIVAVADIGQDDRPDDETLELIAKALRLDPTLVDALTLRARIEIGKWDWSAARATLEQAKSLQPNNPRVHKLEGDLALLAGHRREGMNEYRTALALNPLSHPIACSIVNRYNRALAYDEAIDLGIEVSQGFPDCPFEHYNVGEAYMQKHEYGKAIQYLESSMKVYPLRDTRAAMGCVYALSGERDKAEAILAELSGSDVDAYDLAQLHAALGHDDLALDFLEKAYDERSGSVLWIASEPIFEHIRSNPRFQAIVARLQLPSS